MESTEIWFENVLLCWSVSGWSSILKRILRVIAQPVDLAVGIGSNARRRFPNDPAHRRRPASHGQLVDQLLVDVGMKSRVVLHQVPLVLDHHRSGRSGDLQINLNTSGHHRANLHILHVGIESRRLHRHVVGIKGHARETEISLAVCGRRPVIAADRVMNLDAGIRHHRARRVQHGTANRPRTSAQLFVGSRTARHTGNRQNSRSQPDRI